MILFFIHETKRQFKNFPHNYFRGYGIHSYDQVTNDINLAPTANRPHPRQRHHKLPPPSICIFICQGEFPTHVKLSPYHNKRSEFICNCK